MATVKPFRGLRPPKDLVEKVESRPYDVLDSEEARQEAGDNEMSLYHIIKPEINFEPGTSEYDPRVYEEATRQFKKFQDNGWLVQDKDEHYYIYAQTMNGKTQYGIVLGAYVPDYRNGVIKRHELTRRDKEDDRMSMSLPPTLTWSRYSSPIPTTVFSTTCSTDTPRKSPPTTS